MTRAQRLTLMAGLVLLAVMALLFPSAYSLNLLTQTVVAILICLSYQVLLNQGGLLSFGHAIFTGLGAYVVVHGLNARFGAGLDQWWFVSLLPLMAGAVAAAVGFMLGLTASAVSARETAKEIRIVCRPSIGSKSRPVLNATPVS